MNRFLQFALRALILASTTASVVRAQYVIEQPNNGGYNPWIKGQTFTPSEGIAPDPGAVTMVDLTAITFYRSSQPWVGSTSEFYLNIYDGDPVNGSGAFVGSSQEPVDVASIWNLFPITWTFNHLTLDYDQEYWALVSSTDTAGGLDVYCGMRESGQDDPYTGGTSIAGIGGDPGGHHPKANVDLAFQIDLADTLSLIADVAALPEGPGVVDFEVDAGPGHAGRDYFLVASLSGTAPGTPLPGGLVLPINADLLSQLVFQLDDVFLFHDFIGGLDSDGKAAPRFEWPGVPGSAGLTFYFAGCTASPYDFVTNSLEIPVEAEPVTPSKELFVVYKGSGETRRLGVVDYENPEAIQHVGNLGLKFIRGLSFDGSGTLYAYESLLWGPGQLYEVNQDTAALTPIGPPTSQRVDGMAYNPVDGKMYGVEAQTRSLLSIDLQTGALTFEGTIQDDGPLSWNGMYALAIDDEGYFYTYNNASDAAFSGLTEQGIWRSTQPGGLQFTMFVNLWAELGIAEAAGLDVPVPLFVDWSSSDDRAYGLAPKGNYPFDAFFAFHWDVQGTGWTEHPAPPSGDMAIQAWTAPPQTGE